MKRRIVMWAIAGFLVASLWAVYAAATFPSPLISAQPIVWTLINITCPVAFASFHFHFGIKLYWVLLANALRTGYSVSQWRVCGSSLVAPIIETSQCAVVLHLRQRVEHIRHRRRLPSVQSFPFVNFLRLHGP